MNQSFDSTFKHYYVEVDQETNLHSGQHLSISLDKVSPEVSSWECSSYPALRFLLCVLRVFVVNYFFSLRISLRSEGISAIGE